MKKHHLLSVKFILLAVVVSVCYQCNSVKTTTANSEVSSESVELKIKPSLTDPTITNTDVAHYIKYNPSVLNSKLLLFLPGTKGIPERGPKRLFNTAIEGGYKVINLSYINEQSLSRYCRNEALANDSECAEKFRTQRIYGTQLTNLIPDEPQDGIMNRFEKLLVYLDKTDPKGNWGVYLKDGKPNWSIITVTGQSQGGGMAAFIAKKHKVNRIINFSGGWDNARKGEIAKWYFSESITPSDRWFGVYHTKEPKATTLDESYRAMNIPDDHIFPLNLEVPEGRKAHGQGKGNAIYKPMWEDFFADGIIR